MVASRRDHIGTARSPAGSHRRIANLLFLSLAATTLQNKGARVMVRKQLLLGISAAALAAGTASAQTITDAAGNTEILNCAPGNTCDVENQGSGNERNRG